MPTSPVQASADAIGRWPNTPLALALENAVRCSLRSKLKGRERWIARLKAEGSTTLCLLQAKGTALTR